MTPRRRRARALGIQVHFSSAPGSRPGAPPPPSPLLDHHAWRRSARPAVARAPVLRIGPLDVDLAFLRASCTSASACSSSKDERSSSSRVMKPRSRSGLSDFTSERSRLTFISAHAAGRAPRRGQRLLALVERLERGLGLLQLHACRLDVHLRLSQVLRGAPQLRVQVARVEAHEQVALVDADALRREERDLQLPSGEGRAVGDRLRRAQDAVSVRRRSACRGAPRPSAPGRPVRSGAGRKRQNDSAARSTPAVRGGGAPRGRGPEAWLSQLQPRARARPPSRSPSSPAV